MELGYLQEDESALGVQVRLLVSQRKFPVTLFAEVYDLTAD